MRVGTPARQRPIREAEYYRLDFADHDEASAFMAALSRFITSPAGQQLAADFGPVEVWTTMQRSGARFYLSEAGYRATVAAFSPVPNVTRVRGAEIPRNTMLSMTTFTARPMGFEEAKSKQRS